MAIKTDWFTCDGHGEAARCEKLSLGEAAWTPSRRGILVGAALGLLGWVGRDSALAQVAISPGSERKTDVLVTIFLRGGADGLNMVIPYGEANYYRRRPSLGIAPPSDRTTKGRALDLDGFFGLHPALAPLLPVFHSGEMGIVHACGSGDSSRSHFEAMAAMERGLAREGSGPASGWVARHLLSTEREEDSPLRAIAFADTMPDSLRGATNAVALTSLSDFKLEADAEFHAQLAMLYRPGKDEVAQAGRQTLSALDALGRLDVGGYRAAHGASYPNSDLGNGLRQVACLVKARLGLEVACLDKGGWDTHVAQGADTGWQAMLLDDLAKSLAAFTADLGPEMRGVTVVVMSEFGRRLEENGGLGTDHGRAGPMFLIGETVTGGKVHAKWPGLEDHQLDPTGDLVVTTDYRSVLGDVLARRMGNSSLDDVFPGATPGSGYVATGHGSLI
jgi:uncharacterized protein (DUF1501 family)